MHLYTYSKMAVVVFFASIVLSGCGDKTPAEYVASAKAALEKRDTSAAIINLKNVIKIESNNVEARYLLGKAYLEEGKWASSEKEFTKALDFGFKSDTLYTDLAKSFYYISDLVGLEELSILNLPIEKQEIIDFYYAAENIKQGSMNEGIEMMKLLVAQGLETKYSKLSAVWLAAHDNNVGKVKELIKALLSTEPSFSDAIEFNAHFSYKLNEMETAVNEFQKFLLIHPNANQMRLMYTSALAKKGQFEEADKQADFLLKISPDNPLLNEIKGQVAFINKEYRQAKNFAEKSLGTSNNSVISSIVAGVSAYYLNEFESAYSHLSRVEQVLSFKHPAKKILSAIKLKMGRYDEVYQSLSDSELDELDPELISITANEFLKVGKFNEADNLLVLGEGKNELNGQLSFQRGLTKLLTKDDHALDFFEKALSSDKNNENAAILLTLEHIRLGNYEKAFQVAKDLESHLPALSLTLNGTVYRAQHNLPKARESFMKALVIDHENLAALYYLAEIYEATKEYKLAINNYEKVVTLKNSHQKALIALLRLSKDKEYSGEISEFLQNKLNVTDNTRIIMILAEVYVKQSAIETAISLLEKKIVEMPNNVQLIDHLAKLLLQANRFDKAILAIDKLSQLNIEPIKLYLSKAFIYEQAKQNLNAIAILREGLSLYPKNKYLLTRLIDILIKDRNIMDAKNELLILKEVAEESQTYARYNGKIAFIEKDDFQAIKFLSKAYEQQPDYKILSELSQALQNVNNIEKAITLLSESYKMNGTGFPLDLQLKLAELYTEQQPDKALLLYNVLLSKTAEHYVILNNIAGIYFDEQDYTQAEAFARKALLKSNDNPAVANTLGWILNDSGKIDEGTKYLKKAYLESNKKADFGLHYAEALYKNKKNNEAKNILEEIKFADVSKKYQERFTHLASLTK